LESIVYQVLPTLSYGDAVGNDTLAIARLLRVNGYENEIYAENIHGRNTLQCHPFAAIGNRIRPFDTVIYHLSTGTNMTYWFKQLKCRKILIYHNITPPEFFGPYSSAAQSLTAFGRQTLRDLAGSVDKCIADSQYNADELIELGYTDVNVVPIYIPFSDYRQASDPEVCSLMQDGKTNILFVGRLAPNKRQEDVIAAFYEYKKTYNANSRLILAGSGGGMELYQAQLEKFADALGIREDVIFTGHIPFNHILAYYHTAHAFLCMSEHEGFCVPLVEAMFFKVPVFARNFGAIPETLGHAGVRFDDRNFPGIASAMNYVLTHDEAKAKVLFEQSLQLRKYENDTVENELISCLSEFLK